MYSSYEINEKLKSKILANLPENYSNLEKALLIYKRLCESLQYSFDYYLDEEAFKPYFTDAENLKKIDGESSKDVVCFTFNAIYAHLLEDANIVDEVNSSYNQFSKKFSWFHEPVMATIDGTTYTIDSTMGVLDNNDLVLSKYAGHKPNGWKCLYRSDIEEREAVLQEAIEKVYSENKSFYSAVQDYISLKQNNNELLELPLETRLQMFIDMAMTVDYSLLGFNNLLKYKHLIFNDNEFGVMKKNYTIDQYIDLHFAKNKSTNEYTAFLFYNPEGYTNDVGYENFDKLQVIEISVKNKTAKNLSYEEATQLFVDKKFISIFDKRVYPKMTTPGTIDVVYEFKDGKPMYDHHQNPINVTKRSRHHVKTDVYEELPLEQ